MLLSELTLKIQEIIDGFTKTGEFPKENNLLDYKKELNFFGINDDTEIFLRNFAKDILSFSNGEGGVILLGFDENKHTGVISDIGLDNKNLTSLQKIDLNSITQKFERIAKVGVSIDLQLFQITSRKYYYLLISKQNQTLIPIDDFTDYKIKKGEIIYRASSKNEIANKTTSDFNRFLQVKAQEKSKEFIAIWSNIFPEMVDINPKEVLLINPKSGQVYGFNGKNNMLSSSEIDIDKTETGTFNVILNLISAGEIGKITTDEGKPIYKLIGEINGTSTRDYIPLSTLEKEVKKIAKFKFTNIQMKKVMFHLGWTKIEQFTVENPSDNPIHEEFKEFAWVDVLDQISGREKVVFSTKAINAIRDVIDDNSLHISLFSKNLSANKIAILVNTSLN